MFKNIYEGKKVIVTGHTGFKGAWLSLWLRLMNADVYGISNAVPTEPSLFDVANIESQMKSYMKDIRDLEAMKNIFQEVKPDFVFHLAAQPIVRTAYEDPIDCMTTNVIGTANILEALRTLESNCIAVMITSDKCYDNVEWIWGYKETDALGGKDPYSASKGAAELMIKTYFHSYFVKKENIKIASVRAGNVIGGGDWAAARIVPDCFRAWSRDEKVIIRSPHATRPWQHVLEPLSGYLRTGQLLAQQEKHNINGEPFNFGPPADQNYTVLDLLQELAKNWNASDTDIVQIEPSNFHEAGLLKLNIDKALYYLNWKPNLNFIETAAFTSDWYKEYYQQPNNNMLDFTNKQINDYISIAKSRSLSWALN
jgi:CDP-glucose 4,6-dehydratase